MWVQFKLKIKTGINRKLLLQKMLFPHAFCVYIEIVSTLDIHSGDFCDLCPRHIGLSIVMQLLLSQSNQAVLTKKHISTSLHVPSSTQNKQDYKHFITGKMLTVLLDTSERS